MRQDTDRSKSGRYDPADAESGHTFHLADMAVAPGLPFYLGRAFLDGKDFPNHTHDFSELVVMTGGEGLHDTDGGTHLVHAGDVFVIHREVSHGFRSCRSLSMYNIGFDPRVFSGTELVSLPGFHALFVHEPMLRAKTGYRSNLRVSPAEMEQLVEDMARLEEEGSSKRPGFAMAFRNRFLNLALDLSRRYAKLGGGSARPLVLLGAGAAYLEAGLSGDVSIPEAASRSGLSANQFIRRFSQAYGITPYRYLLGLRLDRASRLLRETGRSITDIAYGCGFNDGNYFSRAFRSRFSASPREYRKVCSVVR